MATEIERKFVLNNVGILSVLGNGTTISQGYMANGHYLVRVRQFGEKACITLKSAVNGLTREEYEYLIPVEDALQMLSQCVPTEIVTKTRYVYPIGLYNLEIDVFSGLLQGLVIAEIELEHESDIVHVPDWLGEDVSHETLFLNSNLARLSASDLPHLKALVASYGGAWLSSDSV